MVLNASNTYQQRNQALSINLNPPQTLAPNTNPIKTFDLNSLHKVESSTLDLQYDINPLKDFALNLIQENKISKTKGKSEKDLTNPETIQNFEALVAKTIIPAQMKLKAESERLKIPLDQEFHKKDIIVNSQPYRLDKEPPESDRKAHTEKTDGADYKKNWDWRYEFSLL